MASAATHIPRIEVLVLDGCPNAKLARELVERVASSLALESRIELLVVPDADAERNRFLGSPTIRVDGVDIEPGAEGRTGYALSCRVYQTASGLAGQPDEAWLRDSLMRALTGQFEVSDTLATAGISAERWKAVETMVGDLSG